MWCLTWFQWKCAFLLVFWWAHLSILEADDSLRLGHLTTKTYVDWVLLRALDSDPGASWPFTQTSRCCEVAFCPHFSNPFKTDAHFNLGFLDRKLLNEPYGTTTDPVLSYLRFCFSNENVKNMKEEEYVIINKLSCLSFKASLWSSYCSSLSDGNNQNLEGKKLFKVT